MVCGPSKDNKNQGLDATNRERVIEYVDMTQQQCAAVYTITPLKCKEICQGESMFKRSILVCVFTICFAGMALAAMPVGVFNSQTIAIDSEPAKAAQKQLQSQFGAERGQIEKLAQNLQKEGESLQAQTAALSQKAREEKQMDFLRKRRDFEEKSRAFAIKVEGRENQIRQTIGRLIFQASGTVAKKRNLEMVFDAAAGSIMYALPSMDITKDVIAEVNRLWKAGGSKFDTAPAKK